MDIETLAIVLAINKASSSGDKSQESIDIDTIKELIDNAINDKMSNNNNS